MHVPGPVSPLPNVVLIPLHPAESLYQAYCESCDPRGIQGSWHRRLNQRIRECLHRSTVHHSIGIVVSMNWLASLRPLWGLLFAFSSSIRSEKRDETHQRLYTKLACLSYTDPYAFEEEEILRSRAVFILISQYIGKGLSRVSITTLVIHGRWC